MKEHGEEILNKVKENNNGLMVLNIKDLSIIIKQMEKEKYIFKIQSLYLRDNGNKV